MIVMKRILYLFIVCTIFIQSCDIVFQTAYGENNDASAASNSGVRLTVTENTEEEFDIAEFYSEPVLLSVQEDNSFRVISAAPADGEKISADTVFTAEFSYEIDESSVEGNVVLWDNMNNQNIDFSYEISGNILRLTPKYELSDGVGIVLSFKSGLKAKGLSEDTAGLSEEKSFYYSTDTYPFSYNGMMISENKMLVRLRNNSDEEKTVYCVAALYDGSLEKELSYKRLSVAACSESSMVFKFTENIGDYKTEIYVWDEIDGDIIRPVMMPKNNADVRPAYGSVPSYGSISAEYDYNTKQFIISSRHETKRAGIPITVRVFKSGDELLLQNLFRAETLVTGENGLVNYAFNLSDEAENGVYTVFINDSFSDALSKKDISYVDAADIEDALEKIDAADIESIAEVFSQVRVTLSVSDSEFDALQNKEFVYNCILDGKKYSEKGLDAFKELYRRALNICILLEGDPDDASEEIKRSHNDEFWNIPESSAYTVFAEKLNSSERAAVIRKMRAAKRFSDLRGIFELAAVCGDIKSQSSYSTVYDALSKHNALTGIDASVYNSLKRDLSKRNVCERFYNAIDGYDSMNALKNGFESIAADEKKKEAAAAEDSNKNTGGGGGGGGGGSAASGVQMLPGLYQTNNPAPEWYKEEDKTTSYTTTFTDTDDVAWAKDEIAQLYGLGAISGKSETLFAPNDSITREELCKIVSAAFSLTADSDINELPFADVDRASWYGSYILICYQNKVINGISSDSFGVGNTVTREEIAAILVRAAEAAGKTLDYDITIFPFEDNDEISDWARESVSVLRECLIIDGVGDGYFAPRMSVTRAEAAKMIAGVLNFSY